MREKVGLHRAPPSEMSSEAWSRPTSAIHWSSDAGGWPVVGSTSSGTVSNNHSSSDASGRRRGEGRMMQQGSPGLRSSGVF